MMRDHFVGLGIAIVFVVALLAILKLIAPQAANAESPMYDQWVPVTRAVSVTSSDYDTVFTWTGDYVFNGVVLDDITIAGTFTGHREMTYIVVVEDDSVNPELFMWSSDGGENWLTGLPMAVGATTLDEGVTVAWTAVVGHANGESWHWTQHTVGHSDIATDVFTGTGLDDLTPSGTYHGHTLRLYRIMVDASVPSPDTFTWSEDGGVTWNEAGVDMMAAGNHLSSDVTVTFAAQDGHTIGDYWDIVATPPSQQLIIGSITWSVTANNAADYVKILDQYDENQFAILDANAIVMGEFIYDPPNALLIGRDLKLDTTSQATMVMYVTINAWLRDVNY